MKNTLTKVQHNALRALSAGGSYGTRAQTILNIFSARTVYALVRKGYITHGVDNENFSTFVITQRGWASM